jgi:NAD(P)-dependent dehydrogenase (short-subunit alcohol dehydrogenase family)
MGRADVAFNYLPEEEPYTREVIALIKAEGRTGPAIPGDMRDEAFCQRLVDEAVRGLGGLDIVISNAGRQQSHASILDIPTEQFNDECEHLRAVLDHHGGVAASEA